MISLFWKLIQREIKIITGPELPINPRFFLLLDFIGLNWLKNEELIFNLVTTASILITECWKSD